MAVKVLLDLEEAQKAEPGAVWTLSNPVLFNLQKARPAALQLAVGAAWHISGVLSVGRRAGAPGAHPS